MNDKEFSEAVHMEIHAVRRINNYKPSQMERNISRFVRERFRDECKECKEVDDNIKTDQPKKSFLSKLGDTLGGVE